MYKKILIARARSDGYVSILFKYNIEDQPPSREEILIEEENTSLD
jgi:hypothetical protein